MSPRAFYCLRLIIPLTLLLQLSSVESVAQLNAELAKINSGTAPTNLTNGALQAEANVERKGYVIPQPAACIPERQVIRLGKSPDWYFPSCTRIERCGGCCGRDDVLSCQPIQVEIVNFQVIVLKYVGGNPPLQKTTEIIPVEKHIKCKCDCKLKAEDCNPLQRYDKTNCECVCTNNDEEEKCLDNSKIKYWNSDTCTCQCIKERDCNTGFTFNKHSCSCEPIQRPRIRFDTYSTDTRPSLSRQDEYSFAIH